MPLTYKALCDFTGGEFSPLMTMRIDVPEYNRAVAHEQNFYTLIQGGAKKRRGQAFVMSLANSAQKGAFIPYVLNTSFTYCVVINNGVMQFIKNGNLINGYSLACPYLEADLPLIRYAQTGSIVYIWHPNYPVFSLQCNGDTNWLLAPTQLTYNATSDINFSNAFINFRIINGDNTFGVGTEFKINMLSGEINSYTPLPILPYALAAQPINLASDGQNFDIATGGIGSPTSPIFMDGIILQVGNYVLLKDQYTPTENGIYLVNPGTWTRATFYDDPSEVNNSLVHVQYGLIWGNQYFEQTTTVTTVGTDAMSFTWASNPPGDGELAGVTSQLGASGTYIWTLECLAASTASQTWQVLGTPATYSAPNFVAMVPTYISTTSFSVPGDQTSYFQKYVTIQFDNTTTLDNQNPPAINTVPRGYITNSVYATGVTTVTVVNYGTTVIPSDLSQVSIIYISMWKPGAYPNAGCFHENRMMVGGSAQFPQFIWGSRSGGYYLDFTNGITSDMGIIEEIAGNDYNQIVHLVSSRQLLIQTTSVEFAMFGPQNQALSGISSNIIKNYTHHGSSLTVRPIRIGKEVLFVQRDDLKVRAISYEITSDSNVAPDITLFSNHMTATGGIIAATFAQNPDYLSWFVTNDGRLLSCAFDRDQSVVAWSQHDTAGLYETIVTVPGISNDYTYVIVNRTINGSSVRFVELMDYTTGKANTLGGPSLMDCFFIQSTPGTPTNIISGLPASMYNATGVAAVLNGTVETNLTVSNTGTITCVNSGDYIVVGFPYSAQIQMLTPELGDSNNPTIARQKGISKVFIQVYNTTDLVFNPNQLDQFGVLVSADVSIPFLTTATGLNEQVAPFTGLKDVDDLGWLTTNQVWIKSPNPTECIINGIIYKLEIGE